MGHVPENAIMPGVLIVESVAQVAGIVCIKRFSMGTTCPLFALYPPNCYFLSLLFCFSLVVVLSAFEALLCLLHSSIAHVMHSLSRRGCGTRLPTPLNAMITIMFGK